MKLYIFNDTSNVVHCGSDAVMRCIYKNSQEHEIIKKHKVGDVSYDSRALDECDAVLVNGEGTIHHNAPEGNFLMDILKLAQIKGKKTYLINALFQQQTPYYNRTLRNLTYFSVRDPLSKRNAIACESNPKLFPDLCSTLISFTQEISHDKKIAIAIGDAHRDAYYCYFLKKVSIKKILLSLNYPQISLKVLSFEELIEQLRQCHLYITGQHHGIYAAGLAGTPFIPLKSNSHKIEALIEWSGLPIKICNTKKDIINQIEFSLTNPDVFKRFQDFLFNQPKMDKNEFNYMFSI